MPYAAAVYRSLFGFVMVVGAGTAVHAQEAVADSATIAGNPRCDSIPPVGWKVDTLYGSVSIQPADALPAGWDDILLEAIREHLHVPQVAGLPIGGTDAHRPGVPDTVAPVIVGQVYADLDRTGRLGAPLLGVSTLSTDMDLSILAAVQGASAAGKIPPFPEQIRAESVRVRFTVEEHFDSAAHPEALLTVRNPIWILEVPVLAKPGNPPPQYPVAASRVNASDDVLVSFVVDAKGRARTETVRVLKGHYREFQLSVLETLPRLRFYPARVDGCPVPQLVQMPFAFRIPR